MLYLQMEEMEQLLQPLFLELLLSLSVCLYKLAIYQATLETRMVCDQDVYSLFA